MVPPSGIEPLAPPLPRFSYTKKPPIFQCFRVAYKKSDAKMME